MEVDDDHVYDDDMDSYFEYNQGYDDTSYFDETEPEPKNNEYTFLMDSDVVQRVEERTAMISSLLSLPKPDASILLRHHNWDPNSVQDSWFSDETCTRKSTGLLLANTSKKRPKTLICGICFEETPYISVPVDAPPCGHIFCMECWTSYISTSIKDGAGCLFLRCPEVSCGVAVCPDMIKRLASVGEYKKYEKYVVSSYVECDSRTKWCPGPGCEYAVEFDCDGGNYNVSCSWVVTHSAVSARKSILLKAARGVCPEMTGAFLWCGSKCRYERAASVERRLSEVGNICYWFKYVVVCDGEFGSSHVSCRCSYKFCWNCTEEVHRPVDCTTVTKWIAKNEAESENVIWILAFTKPCPKCKRPIEKNTGCNHMTCCAPCKFEFCWLCLTGFRNHVCNRYNNANINKDEVKRDMAKKSILRYTHYFERWATNRKSEKKALADLREMESVKINKLSDIQDLQANQLRFVTDAWKKIVECRQILKWTYAFGYYLCEEELAKKQFFEYLQGEAEAALERLHNCAEKDLNSYMDAKEPCATFNDFQTKLTGLTAVTGNFFENLVKALENGLSDVDSSKTGKPQRMQITEHGQVNELFVEYD